MHIWAYIYAYSIENTRLRSPLHTVRPPGGRCGVRNTPATYFKHCYRLQEYVLDDYCRSKAPPPALLTAYMCGVTIPAGSFAVPPSLSAVSPPCSTVIWYVYRPLFLQTQFNENSRRPMGQLNPVREKNQGMYRSGDGNTPVTTA